MKNGKELINNCIKRGWVQVGHQILTPAQAAALDIKTVIRKSPITHHKTGWTDDSRNIANKAKHAHPFITLVKQQLNLEVWPEFHFLLKPNPDYRFDYAIPEHMIAVEQEGGIWAKGNSGHSSGKGIMRDMNKASLAAVNGWTLIRRTPSQLLTNETLELIFTAIRNKKNLQ